jgi:hypothetical protein
VETKTTDPYDCSQDGHVFGWASSECIKCGDVSFSDELKQGVGDNAPLPLVTPQVVITVGRWRYVETQEP